MKNIFAHDLESVNGQMQDRLEFGLGKVGELSISVDVQEGRDAWVVTIQFPHFQN